MKKYLWNWKGGGYHTCFALNKEHATRQAKEIGKCAKNTLHPYNVRLATTKDIKDLERQHRGMFD